LVEVRVICEAIEGTAIDHLIIQDTPIAKFTYLEGYVATLLPKLQYFNAVSIFIEDRSVAKDLLKPFIRIPAVETQVTDHCNIANCAGVVQPTGTRRVSCWSYIATDDGRADKEVIHATTHSALPVSLASDRLYSPRLPIIQVSKDQSPLEKVKTFWTNCSKSGQRAAKEVEESATRRAVALRALPRAFHKLVGQVVLDTVEGLAEFQAV
jgi:hypothetical protein